MKTDEKRPHVSEHLSAKEFARWYWPVTHLEQFCELLKVSTTGTKAEMRARVFFALDNPGTPPPTTSRRKRQDKFPWASAALTGETVITHGVSFGPNVRSFFKQKIGRKFVCHSDIMEWMKSNVGATLDDAVSAWHVLEDRKLDPTFRREIAECNNYLRYLRDIRDHNQNLTLDEAIACWDQKKIRPTKDGIVIYEKADLTYLE